MPLDRRHARAFASLTPRWQQILWLAEVEDRSPREIAGQLGLAVAAELAAEVALVPEGRICTELLALYQEDGIVAEPAGALSIAARILATWYGRSSNERPPSASRGTSVPCHDSATRPDEAPRIAACP